jgi:hypothetical protein
VSTTAPGGDDVSIEYELTIPAAERLILMHFAVQSHDRSEAVAAAQELATLVPAALTELLPNERLEIVNFLAFIDTDGDGLTDDEEELLYGTDTELYDTDGDGAGDGFEVLYDFDPLDENDGLEDTDADGLTNAEEEAAGTHPREPDTDNDGLSDGDEVVVYLTDPLDPDTDGDGFSDGDEVVLHGTDPLLRDTDGGGRTDFEEVVYDGTDPLDPADDNLPVEISRAGAPFDPVAVTDNEGNLHLLWVGELGCGYQLLYSMISQLGEVLIDHTPLAEVCDIDDLNRLRRPAVAIGGDDLVHLVWEEEDGGGEGEVLYAKIDPSADDQDGSVADPGAITVVPRLRVGTFDENAALTVDQAGNAHLVSQTYDDETDEFDLSYARVTPDGVVDVRRDFAFVNRVNSPPSIAVDSDGAVHVMWEIRDFVEGDGVFYWMFHGTTGETLIDATNVSPGFESYDPFIGAGPGGQMTLVFYTDESSKTVRLRVDAGLDDRDGDAADIDQITVAGPEPLGLGHGFTSGVLRDGDAYITWRSFGVLYAAGLGLDGSEIFPPQTASGGFTVRELGAPGLRTPTLLVPWIRRDDFTLEDVLMLSTVNPDDDLDGLSNVHELLIGTFANDPDSDGDGASDGFEVKFGFNPLEPSDASLDADGDGLTNAEEESTGTNPLAADTDGDFLSDGDELVLYFTDPRDPDTDGDGLLDGEEIALGTNPSLPDTDNGGRSDFEEVVYDGTNPTDPNDDNTATEISRAGNPFDPAAGTDAAGNTHLIWSAELGCGHQLLYSMVSISKEVLIDATPLSEVCDAGYQMIRRADLAVGGSGLVHLVWQERGSGGSPDTLRYSSLDPSLDDQDGSPADSAALLIVDRLEISLGERAALTVDSEGKAHIVSHQRDSSGSDAVNYLQINTSGAITIGQGFGEVDYPRGRADLTVDPLGHVHVTWGADLVVEGLGLYYWMLDGSTGAVLIDATNVGLGPYDGDPSIGSGPGHWITLVYEEDERRRVVRRIIDPSLDNQDGTAADIVQITVAGPDPLTSFGADDSKAVFDGGDIFLSYHSNGRRFSLARTPDGIPIYPRQSVTDGFVYLQAGKKSSCSRP